MRILKIIPVGALLLVLILSGCTQQPGKQVVSPTPQPIQPETVKGDDLSITGTTEEDISSQDLDQLSKDLEVINLI